MTPVRHIVRLQGGLGNQLFQWAFAVFLQESTQSEVLFDTRYLRRRRQHTGFELSKFQNEFAEADSSLHDLFPEQSVRSATHFGGWRIFRRLSGQSFRGRLLLESPKLDVGREIHVLKERLHGHDSSVWYWNGYWQNQAYLRLLRSTIQERLVFPNQTQLGPYFQRMTKRIVTSSFPVAVHIRRGDYVQNKKIQRLYGTCSDRYFVNQIRRFQLRYSATDFFVFSDAPGYCQKLAEQVGLGSGINYVNVESNEFSPSESIQLMTRCRGHVLSNSTFGWWGAYLARHSRSVVYPTPWFNDSALVSPLVDFPDWESAQREGCFSGDHI